MNFEFHKLAPDKVRAKIESIMQDVPENKLPSVIADLRAYARLKQLNEVSYRDLPEDIRYEIGTRDPMDVFLDEVSGTAGEQWDSMQDFYGPEWTYTDVNKLIEALESR